MKKCAIDLYMNVQKNHRVFCLCEHDEFLITKATTIPYDGFQHKIVVNKSNRKEMLKQALEIFSERFRSWEYPTVVRIDRSVVKYLGSKENEAYQKCMMQWEKNIFENFIQQKKKGSQIYDP